MSRKPLTPSPAVWLHILFGDDFGGGHLSGQGVEGKTEFPHYWQLARIEQAVASAVSNIQARDSEPVGVFEELVDGILLRIVVRSDAAGNSVIRTAYPLRGNGVFQNQYGAPVS